MSVLRIKNSEHLRGVLREHQIDLSIWQQKNPQGIKMLWRELQNKEARIVKDGDRIYREVWVATIKLYHQDGPTWQILSSDRRHETSVSGKYAHLKGRFFRESPLSGVLREMEEELGFSDLKIVQSVSSETIWTRSTGKYPSLPSQMHIREYAGVINPNDFKAGYVHHPSPGYSERFWWEYCDTPEIFKNQFS